jgi:hypothetical protein
MRKERKHFASEKQVTILRRHLLGKIPVSNLCEELGPTGSVQKGASRFCASPSAAGLTPLQQIERMEVTRNTVAM